VSTRGAVAELAAFKIRFSPWTVTRSGTDFRRFTAIRGGVSVTAATLGELASRINEAEAAWPS
jgi:hypothetical protein